MSVTETVIENDPVATTAEAIAETEYDNEAEIQAVGYQQGDDVEVEAPSDIATGLLWLEKGEDVKPKDQVCPVYFKTKTPRDLKAVVKGIATLIEEATLEFTPEGMTFRAMDPSHIALIDVVWPNHAFEAYEVQGTCRIGVRVDELSKILRDFDDKKDLIKFSFDPFGEDGGTMISLDNGNGSAVKVRTIETYGSSTPLPKLHYNAKVSLTSKELDKAYKFINKVSEYVKLSTQYGKFTFSGKGDTGDISKKYEAGAEGLEELQVKEDSAAIYSLDYLMKAHKAMMFLNPSTVLEYSSKMPLRVEYRIANVGRVHFYLAPRVQD